MAAAEETGILSCSFCGKPHTEIEALIAGPGVYICNECVGFAEQFLGSPQIAPWQRVNDVDAILKNLPRIERASGRGKESLTGWVTRARMLGATWDRIGSALGMTKQSAWERFSGEEQPPDP
jgi:hypothetical protein